MLTLPDAIVLLLEPFRGDVSGQNMGESPGAVGRYSPCDAQADRHLGAPGHGD